MLAGLEKVSMACDGEEDVDQVVRKLAARLELKKAELAGKREKLEALRRRDEDLQVTLRRLEEKNRELTNRLAVEGARLSGKESQFCAADRTNYSLTKEIELLDARAAALRDEMTSGRRRAEVVGKTFNAWREHHEVAQLLLLVASESGQKVDDDDDDNKMAGKVKAAVKEQVEDLNSMVQKLLLEEDDGGHLDDGDGDGCGGDQRVIRGLEVEICKVREQISSVVKT